LTGCSQAVETDRSDRSLSDGGLPSVSCVTHYSFGYLRYFRRALHPVAGWFLTPLVVRSFVRSFVRFAESREVCRGARYANRQQSRSLRRVARGRVARHVWQAEDAARGTPTQLLVAGDPTTFEALNVTAYGSQHLRASAGLLESACIWQNASRTRWSAAATSTSPSPVIVLGTSVSAGCGGGAPRGACSVGYSWARLLQDFLDLQLRRAGVPGLRARVNVYSKNAVAAGYYMHCTGAKVPPGPGVVLLEVATNLWGSADGVRKEATALVRAVRRVAPEKVIAGQLSQAQWSLQSFARSPKSRVQT
jgi:hypothetical protein